MDKLKLAAQAREEACSPLTTAHHGGGAGRPFWNPEAYQFLYAPSFQFQPIPGVSEYRYTAVDENGAEHSFAADNASALLAPIWGKIPTGVVQLKVEALNKDGTPRYQVGSRTFFKLDPFPANLPGPARSYREAATLAYDYAFSLPSVQHWLKHGVPDPTYNLNVYATKMFCATASGMLHYAELRPERAEDAMKIARSCMDYLISISEPADKPLAFLPPTYYIYFRENPEEQANITAGERDGTMMMIYPAVAGSAYLRLEKATGDKKYFDAAMKIAEFYRTHVLENGSWPIILDRTTGEPVSRNVCMPMTEIVPFLMAVYERTGEGVWRTLADNATAFVEREVLPRYDWEGQFEDSSISANYSNLAHYAPGALTKHYTKYFADDPDHMAAAEDMIRFVEDQFVIWGRPAPWVRDGYPTDRWDIPCGLEQYKWHMPIDASTAEIAVYFLSLYKAGRGELYLAKALALMNEITRVQHENGEIPTHWMNEDNVVVGAGFWINCHLFTASVLYEFDKFVTEQGIAI